MWSIRFPLCLGRLTALFVLALLIQPSWAQENTWRITTAKNIDIHEFIAQIAEITGKTFVIDPKLRGQVTVISDMALDQDGVYALFLSVLRLQNYTAVPSGNVVRIQQTATGKQTPGAVGDLSQIAPEELVTRVIAAQNVASSELLKILRPLIPQYGFIGAVETPNVVIISDHADNIIRLKKLIQQIDVSDEEEVVMVSLKEAWVGTVVEILERVAPDQLGRNAKGPQSIQIIANERNNTLVLRGKPRPIAEVLKIVDSLDRPATTADSTQVIRLSHADAVATANILNGIISGIPTDEEVDLTGETTIQADESLNAIVVRADPGTMAEIMSIVRKLDVRKHQVLIEAAIVEITIDDTSALGIELAAADGRGESVPFFSTSLDGILNGLLSGLVPDVGEDPNVLGALASVSSPTLAVAKIDADGVSFAAVVNALATNSQANLLSTPSIMTLDNSEAHILVGREVPFRTGSFTTNNESSGNPFTTVQREDVGIELTVTPHIYEGTEVRLDVAHQITNVLPTPVGGSAFADVVTSKRTIETTILAEDGQTIVLGGLIQDDTNDNQTRVPFFGSIPLVGHLFKSKTKRRSKTNLLVFLRPTVLRNTKKADSITKSRYEHIWEVEINSKGHEEYDEMFRGERPQ